MLKRVAIPVALLIAAGPLAAQQKWSLTRPDAEFAEPYTSLRSVREFADGRVVVADPVDKVVHLVDFRTGVATKIGREGQGPEEYALPMVLFPTPDGGALLQDFGTRRFLPIGADGRIGKAFSPPTSPAPSGAPRSESQSRRMMPLGLFNAQATDGKGNLYFQGTALPGEDGKSVDSVPLMRWAPNTSRVDTVGWLPVTEGMRPQVTRTGGNGMMVRLGGGVAWPKQTSWGVAPDGRIAIVTPEPYRVTWITPAGRVSGPVVPYTPIKVTEADKKQFREEQSRARPIVATFGGPAGGRAPPPVRPDPGEVEFPATKPPFSGFATVLVAPDGQIWVLRLRPAADRTPLYDVFDQQGRKIAEVTLRPRSRVVGFGQGTVYVARSDEDDLQYLERYRRN